jgi:hypothetical protein
MLVLRGFGVSVAGKLSVTITRISVLQIGVVSREALRHLALKAIADFRWTGAIQVGFRPIETRVRVSLAPLKLPLSFAPEVATAVFDACTRRETQPLGGVAWGATSGRALSPARVGRPLSPSFFLKLLFELPLFDPHIFNGDQLFYEPPLKTKMWEGIEEKLEGEKSGGWCWRHSPLPLWRQPAARGEGYFP